MVTGKIAILRLLQRATHTCASPQMHTQSLMGLWQTQLPLSGHSTAAQLLPSRLQRAACHAATIAVAQERSAGQASTSGRSGSERLAPGIAGDRLLSAP